MGSKAGYVESKESARHSAMLPSSVHCPALNVNRENPCRRRSGRESMQVRCKSVYSVSAKQQRTFPGGICEVSNCIGLSCEIAGELKRSADGVAELKAKMTRNAEKGSEN